MKFLPVQKKYALIVTCAAVSVFFICVILVFIIKDFRIDENVFQLIAPYHTASATRFMKAVSFLGKHSFLIPANLLLIVFFLFQKNKSGALQVVITALSSLGMMSLLKNLFHRHRPPQPLVEGITNFSFPSGHAFMSVVFYGLLIYFIKQQTRQRELQTGLIIFLVLLILLIGLSRIYLRVHYASDVLAGFAGGIAWFTFCLWIVKQFYNKKSESVPKL